MPAHTHSVTGYTAAGGNNMALFGQTGAGSINTGSTGSGGNHSNIPPVIIVNYVIKT